MRHAARLDKSVRTMPQPPGWCIHAQGCEISLRRSDSSASMRLSSGRVVQKLRHIAHLGRSTLCSTAVKVARGRRVELFAQ